MIPSFHSFAEELALIKLSKKKSDVVDRPTLKKFVRGALIYGPATGVGWGLGHLTGKTLLPKILKGATPLQRKLVGGTAGVLGGLVSARAFDVLTREKAPK